MSDAEIQFAYDLQPIEGEILNPERFAELSAWRSILHAQDLVGHHPDYNHGFSFGNLSCRSEQELQTFVITGSQTGSAKRFSNENLVKVIDANLERFWVESAGLVPPSMDTMTHAAIYASDERIEYIFHIHSAEIWQHADALNIPTITSPSGSPQASQAVIDLMGNNQSRPLVFIQSEVQNSVFAMGHLGRDCGGLLITYLAKARALSLCS